MDSVELVHEAEVDAYTDMVLDIVDSDEARADKRARIRALIEWIV